MRQLSAPPPFPLFVALSLFAALAFYFLSGNSQHRSSSDIFAHTPTTESSIETFGEDEPLPSFTASNRRKLLRNFASSAECEDLIRLFAPPTRLRKVPHSIGLSTLSNSDVAEHPNTAGVATLARLRAKMIRLAKQYFGREDVWPHTTNLAVRRPEFVDDPVCEAAHNCSDDYLRSVEWSSSVHADNCMWQPWDRACVFLPCCHMRAFSLVLYLNECEGGEFVFDEIEEDAVPMEKIKPTAGTLVMFPGTVDNRHGVGRVRSTKSRYTLYLWLTHQKELAEPTLHWMGT